MHRATIAENIVIADAFFGSRADKFAWHAPDGGSIAFPRLLTGLRHFIYPGTDCPLQTQWTCSACLSREHDYELVLGFFDLHFPRRLR